MEPPVNNASGGSTPRIMVFRPTWDEFKDFNKYILYMESCGAHKAGLAKVVPPPEWNPRKAGYDMEEIGKILIPSPISQVVTGKQGVYQQLNIQKAKMTVKDFQKVADSDRYKTPRHFDYEDLERKYWKNITYVSPIYGADVAGSLTDSDVKEWNINKLGSILDFINEDYGIQIDGVNTAYLYFGMWKTSFAWHTEDMDLYSINYLHFGAPKSWYAVPPEHGRRLERMANGFFPSNFKECPAYLRHKMFVISPQILKMYSIPYSKITQEPGEFMVTFPYGYHAGFNHGFNCAESTNFASPRWVEYGKRAVQCHCRNDMVKISMDTFVKRFQPERYELWIQGLDIGPHPEDSGRSAAAAPPTIDDILCNKNNTIIPDGFFNQKKHKRHPIHKKAKDVELLESGQESSGLEPPSVNEPVKEIKEEVPKPKRKNSCSNQSGGKRRPKNSVEPPETFIEKKPVVLVQRMQPSMDEVSASSMLLRLQSMSGPSPAPGPSSNRGWGQQAEMPAYKQQYGFDQRASSEPPVLEAQTYANEGRNPHSEPPLLQPVFEELFTPRHPRDAPPVLSPEGIKQSIKKEELQQPVPQIPDQCSRNVLPTAVAVPIEPRPPSFTDQGNSLQKGEMASPKGNREVQPYILERRGEKGNVEAPPWSRPLNFLFQDSGCSFQKEAEFNYFCSQAEPNCSVCGLLFAPRHRAVDYCTGDWKLQPPAASASSSPVLLSEQVFAWHIRLGAFTKLPPVENQSTLKISGLLRCSSCCVCVHASCYGVPETTSPYDWLCRRCQAGDSAAACCLCTLRGGALKPTGDGRWAHITCTIAIPEIHFEDLPQREPVNAAHVLKERARLLCIYCQQPRGVCVQCTVDRCSQAFHVSCGQAAGARFKPGQFPVGVNVVCTKHKVGQTSPGQLVWARYHNNRFYRARVKSIEDAIFYWVDFSDGSTSKDTYPEDILNYKCKEHGPPPVGAAVHVLWTDGKAYDGTFRGTVSKKMFTVEFEDSTVLSLEKEHVFDLDQDLPKRVQHRICNEHLPNPENS